MTAAAGIALANALIAGLEILIPKLSEWFKSGEISVEEQQKTRDRYLALRSQGDGAFAGPEWEVIPDEPQAPV